MQHSIHGGEGALAQAWCVLCISDQLPHAHLVATSCPATAIACTSSRWLRSRLRCASLGARNLRPALCRRVVDGQ